MSIASLPIPSQQLEYCILTIASLSQSVNVLIQLCQDQSQSFIHDRWDVHLETVFWIYDLLWPGWPYKCLTYISSLKAKPRIYRNKTWKNTKGHEKNIFIITDSTVIFHCHIHPVYSQMDPTMFYMYSHIHHRSHVTEDLIHM